MYLNNHIYRDNVVPHKTLKKKLLKIGNELVSLDYQEDIKQRQNHRYHIKQQYRKKNVKVKQRQERRNQGLQVKKLRKWV